MRHQAEDVALLVDDPGEARARAVERLRVAEDDLAVCLDLVEQFVVRVPAALSVLDRDREQRLRLTAGRERRIRALDAERDVPADEGQGVVPAQRARQQAGLAEDLE